VHQSHLCLYHDIVTSPVAIRSCLTIAGDTGIDQLGVDLSEGLIVHSIFLECTWKIVLNEDVALLCELVEDLDA
jgi:hypothetical protein